MPRVKYSGGYRPGVAVTLDDGRVLEVEYLHEIEVSAADRDRLTKQAPDDWSEVKPASESKSDTKEKS